VPVFNHGFCCVTVSIIGLRLLHGVRFGHGFCCVRVRIRSMAFLSDVHFLTGWHCKFRPNTEGNGHTDCMQP
jgi:hypothetical protein